jgi:hypothetical protein
VRPGLRRNLTGIVHNEPFLYRCRQARESLLSDLLIQGMFPHSRRPECMIRTLARMVHPRRHWFLQRSGTNVSSSDHISEDDGYFAVVVDGRHG